ncbi:helix-turn-helix domain-containing protein [Pseudomonadota bacterium]|jgi:AraC family ethanolamine operon transcriptional activator
MRKLFQDVFQTSPYQYLINYRLQCVRHELERSLPDSAIISQIATQYGFEELGRFSQYYRLMYAELPTETLKT